LQPLEAVLARADLVIIATPHPEYRGLQVSVPVADVWNLLGKGVLV
jgi:UDP-N-acetyl-D-mannosaminuronic acid dehydrogenase